MAQYIHHADGDRSRAVFRHQVDPTQFAKAEQMILVQLANGRPTVLAAGPNQPSFRCEITTHGRCLHAVLWDPQREGIVKGEIFVAGHSRCGARAWAQLHREEAEQNHVVPMPPQAPWVGYHFAKWLHLAPPHKQTLTEFIDALAWAWIEIHEARSADESRITATASHSKE